MSGVILAETEQDIANALNANNTFITALQNFANGSASLSDIVLAASAFGTAAAQALESTALRTYASAATGAISGLASLQEDLNAFANADAQNSDGDRYQAFVNIINDAAGIGGGIAAVVGQFAKQAGAPALAAQAAIFTEAFTILGGVALAAGTIVAGANGLTNYLQTLDDALNQWAVKQSQSLFDISSGNGLDVTIVMSGNPGDSSTSSTLGGTGFTYTENGDQPGSVQVAENGATDVVYDNGQNMLADMDDDEVHLGTVTGMEIDGNNNSFIADSGISQVAVVGSGNSFSFNASSSGSSVNLGATSSTSTSIALDSAENISFSVNNNTSKLVITSFGTSSISIASAASDGTNATITGGDLSVSGNSLNLDLQAGSYKVTGSNDNLTLEDGASVSINQFVGEISDLHGNQISVTPIDPNYPGYYYIYRNNSPWSFTGDVYETKITASDAGSLTVDLSYQGNPSEEMIIDSEGASKITGYYGSGGGVYSISEKASDGVSTRTANFYADGQVSGYRLISADGSVETAYFNDGDSFAHEIMYEDSSGNDSTALFIDGSTGRLTSVEAFTDQAQIAIGSNAGDVHYSEYYYASRIPGELDIGDYDAASGQLTGRSAGSGSIPDSLSTIPTVAANSFTASDPLQPAAISESAIEQLLPAVVDSHLGLVIQAIAGFTSLPGGQIFSLQTSDNSIHSNP